LTRGGFEGLPTIRTEALGDGMSPRCKNASDTIDLKIADRSPSPTALRSPRVRPSCRWPSGPAEASSIASHRVRRRDVAVDVGVVGIGRFAPAGITQFDVARPLVGPYLM
jgi:hypothetical protein